MTDTATAAGSPAKSSTKRIELTIRALILGCILAVIFTMANVYIGLKVGLTFASSIPAAVISMALLRAFKTSTIWENMTVQTVASIGGAISSVIFVLPALVMTGWWQTFPFWESALICAFGGILGVTFSIPLRRALVINSALPYPEGVAAAEVLKVGSRGEFETEAAVRENQAGLLTVIWSSIASALYAWLVATRAFVGAAETYFRLPAALGGGVSGISFGMQFALLGAGHLVGLAVGIAMGVGFLIAWAVCVPVMTAMQATPGEAAAAADVVWRQQVRFMGAGAIGVAAIWTLLKLIGPLVGGVTSALAAQRKRAANEVLDRTEQDIPITTVALISLGVLAAIAALLWSFTNGTPLAASAPALVIGGLIYVVLIGFIVAAICGYMAGLIGSSNSPVSGVGIIAIVAASLLMLGAMQIFQIAADPSIIAFALLITAIVFSISVVSNDNLQDLKTGQLVGATPWRQQLALIVGCIAGALVIPFVLNLLNYSNGFPGGPDAGVPNAQTLSAPQATLIAALAKGVIEGGLNWALIGIGALIGVGIIIIDEILVRTSGNKRKLPPLAVGIGIYLPMAVTTMVVIGAVAGAIYNRWVSKKPSAEVAKRLGILLASGMIVGESLFGVLLSGTVAASGQAEPYGLVPAGWGGSPIFAMIASVAGLAVASWGLYAWAKGKAAKV